ncbi:MAG: hypothetical protein ACRCWQ_14830 [Bacilli bacterium]
MKIHHDDIEIFSSSTAQEDAFQILATRAAFDILSNKLYSNKPRAIIRELSCNAIDAMRAAGTLHTHDYDIHLPTALDPVFWIRDRGTGIAPENIKNVFIVYFASTKQDSNDDIGGMGLGCKSPYSYSKIFNVTSFYNGMRYTYEMSIVGGEPKSKLISTVESDEHSGILISMPVETCDNHRFRAEAEYVLRTLEKAPNFIGTSVDLTFVKKERYLPSSRTVKYFETDHLRDGLYALMAGVIYPIKDIGYSKNLNVLYASRCTAVVFEFENGDLDVHPSREELSYEDRTIEKLNEVIGGVDDTLYDEIVKEYVEIDDPRVLYRKICSEVRIQTLRTEIINNYIIRGKTLSEWNTLYRWDEQKSLGMRRLERTNNVTRIRYLDRHNTKSNNYAHLSNSRGLIVLVMDTKNQSYVSFYNYLVDTNTIDTSEMDVVAIPNASEAYAVQKIGTLESMFEFSPSMLKVMKLSDYATKVRDHGKTLGKIKATVTKSLEYTLNENSHRTYLTTRNTQLTTKDLAEKEFYYCNLYYDDMTTKDGSRTLSRDLVIVAMKLLGIDTLYGIRSKYWKAADRGTGINIIDALSDYIADTNGYRTAMKSSSHRLSGIVKMIHQTREPLFNRAFGLTHNWNNKKRTLTPLDEAYRMLTTNTHVLSADAKNQVQKYKGAVRAHEMKCSEIEAKLYSRYPLIYAVLRKQRNNDEHEIDSVYVPEIKTLVLNHK